MTWCNGNHVIIGIFILILCRTILSTTIGCSKESTWVSQSQVKMDVLRNLYQTQVGGVHERLPSLKSHIWDCFLKQEVVRPPYVSFYVNTWRRHVVDTRKGNKALYHLFKSLIWMKNVHFRYMFVYKFRFMYLVTLFTMKFWVEIHIDCLLTSNKCRV